MIFSSAFNMDSLIFGTAYLKAGPLGKLDPRIKLLATLFLILVTALTIEVRAYFVLSLLLVIALGLSRMPIKLLLVNVRPFIILTLITFILHLVFSSESGRVILNLGVFEVTENGLIRGLMFSWRILIMFVITVAFNMSTDPLDISDSLVSLMGPLKKLKLNVDQVGLLFFMALRFIPLLSQRLQAIYSIQVSRGFNPQGSVLQKLKNSLPLFKAVLASLIRSADHIALALQARGFHPDRRRTSVRKFKICGLDYLVVLIVGGVCVTVLYLEYYA